MKIYSNQYVSLEQLEYDIEDYKQKLMEHSFTINIPAPLSPNDLVEHIVKNNIEYEWVIEDPSEAEVDFEVKVLIAEDL